VRRHLSRKATVHLACLADEPFEAAAVRALEAFCKKVAVVRLPRYSRWLRALGSIALTGTITEGAFRSAELRTTLRGWARQTHYHATLASASSMAPYLRLPELREVPAVVDLVDVDSQKWLDYAAGHRGPLAWLYRTEGVRLRRLEQSLSAWARALTLVSDAEVDLCRTFCPASAVRVATNGVDLDYYQPTPAAVEPSCVFVGALDYWPNVDGVCWFCTEVWPQVRQQRPKARLYLVGRKPAPAVRRLGCQPGVELIGQVPDIRPWLARAAVAVAPLRIARGVQNKVLEALAMGKATVISPSCRAGLRAQPGWDLLVASSPVEWTESVLRLLDDEALRRQLGAAGRRHVEEHHCWDRCLQPFDALLGLREE
jgi:sugar transferase (PEP-CTERM/EpsH1 system associated)